MKISHILLFSILNIVAMKNSYALTENQEKLQVLNVVKKYAEVAVYERSKKLRDFAIANFTKDGRISCQCCTFNFEDFYGAEIGKGFIEIHHTKPIFKYLDEDIENTLEHAVKNLAPVCSNCHRMIHRNWSKPLEIQDLISNVNQYGVFKRFA